MMTTNKSRNSTFLYLLLAIMLSLGTCLVNAQTVTGSVTGEVTDNTGAVIPKASVVVIDTDTGVQSPTSTNDAGVYTVRFLPIGHYSVTVSAPGFAVQTVPAFTLEINQTVKLNTMLGANSQVAIEVDSTAATILNTTDASLGVTLSTNEIANIPLEGRNFSSATLFQPGAVNTDPTGLTGNNAIERETTNNGTVSINGNRNQANNYLLDGIDLNEGQNNLIGYNPAPDAIGEIKVISANAPASYGNVNGGAVVSLLKSGTNKFHGSAYGYLQNQNLDANSWNNKNSPTITPRNPFTQTIFGGTFGGPVRIPHLFDGHDKLFFFGDYEGARNHSGGSGKASVYTAAMRAGDFSAFPTQLYDTQNGFTPYLNNQLPIVNPVAIYLFAHPELYPLPNVAAADNLTHNNYSGPTKTSVVNNQFDVKISYNPRSADRISGFYAQSRAHDITVPVLLLSFPGQGNYPSTLGGGTWVHTFSTSIVNEARLGFTRVNWGQGVPTDPLGAFGLKGDSIVGIPFGIQHYVGFASQELGNNPGQISAFGTRAAPQVFVDNTFTYGDNLTIQRGKHLLSMGVTALRYQQQYTQSQNAGANGVFNYSGVFTSNPAVGAQGYGPADFVLNNVNQAQLQVGGEFGNRQWRTAGFFQDDWKLTPSLTVNLGLRYEYDQPIYEVNNRNGNVLPGGIVEYAGSVPVGAPAGSLVCPNRACYKPNYKQFMPRLGFAYQATPRFVVRGGYGATSFFEGDDANQRLTFQNPFVSYSSKQSLAPSATSGGQAYTVQEGFSSNPTDVNASGAGYGQWPQNIQPAYIQEFNLTTEYAINSKTSLQVGYVGETGQHIEDYGNANQLTTAQAAIIGGLASGAPIPAAAVAPYANLVGQGGTLLITESRAMMNYNALQLTLRQRESHGLEYTFNYTYARAMTNSSGNFGTPGVTGSSGAFQDYYNSRADYGPAGQDVRNNASAIVVYALPYGRGRQFGSHANRLLDETLGGWSISSTLVAFTGVPVTLGDNGNSNTNNAYGGQRPNQYRHMKIVGRSVNNWWGKDPSATPCTAVSAQNVAIDNGTCAYGQTAAYTFGTGAIGTERAPGFYQVDSSIFKDFHITEGQKFSFRADAFNLLNVADYGNPDANINDSSFGLISTVRNQERRLQLALTYAF
ncbi:hypothetical protein HDF16_005702 [Granulicella aggregans]|uniref:TonB-dependent transporter Oar-like beta-barrel domain-containing protein n=1 Tax=Granulicella aggregans TaxID=474949 RepID=A0A7W7ZJA6_9BACT|nr:TonB-dependent receptor [Granulicella aggregans]MBB5060966.1 hypothetical protein [Granulicella aggregans]